MILGIAITPDQLNVFIFFPRLQNRLNRRLIDQLSKQFVDSFPILQLERMIFKSWFVWLSFLKLQARKHGVKLEDRKAIVNLTD